MPRTHCTRQQTKKQKQHASPAVPRPPSHVSRTPAGQSRMIDNIEASLSAIQKSIADLNSLLSTLQPANPSRVDEPTSVSSEIPSQSDIDPGSSIPAGVAAHIASIFPAPTDGIDYEPFFKEIRESPELLNGLQIIRTTSGISTKSACANLCGNENTCSAFALKSDSCILLTNDPFGTNPYIHDSSTSKLFGYIGGTFSVLAYRVPSGVGGDALTKYNDNSAVSTDAETITAVDLSSPLTQVYKSAILDQWNAFPVIGVTAGFVRSDDTLGEVVFNGESSTSKFDWMLQSNLLSSPWVDLTTSSLHDDFGVIGPENTKRRFYINRHLGCPRDLGFLMLVTPTGDPCPWASDGGLVDPEIMYAPGNMAVVWNTGAFGKAKEFRVVMKVRCE